MMNCSSRRMASFCATSKHIAEDILFLTAGFGAGAGVMYLCDPNRGRTRRSRLATELSGLIRRDERKMAKRAKDLLHRVGGLAAEGASAFTEEAPVADDVLIERVRSRLGHVVSHPHEIDVHASEGVVTLSGKLTRAERRRVREEVKTIAGVKYFNDCLTSRSAFVPGLLVGLAAGLTLLGQPGSAQSK